jgi:hypothetical protein
VHFLGKTTWNVKINTDTTVKKHHVTEENANQGGHSDKKPKQSTKPFLSKYLVHSVQKIIVS